MSEPKRLEIFTIMNVKIWLKFVMKQETIAYLEFSEDLNVNSFEAEVASSDGRYNSINAPTS